MDAVTERLLIDAVREIGAWRDAAREAHDALLTLDIDTLDSARRQRLHRAMRTYSDTARRYG